MFDELIVRVKLQAPYYGNTGDPGTANSISRQKKS